MEQLLLYDRVFLSTKNFLVVPLLVEWAGMNNLLRLLRDNRIGFTRPTGFIGYDGLHKTMEFFIFTPRFSGDFDKDWLKIADAADLETSVRAIINKGLSNHPENTREELAGLVLRNAKQVDDPRIGQRIHDETEADFLDEEIRRKLLINAKDLKNACDIAANQMKIGLDQGPFDPEQSREIDKALAIGFTNYDLIIGEAIGDVDIYTDNISRLILEAKLRRNLKSELLKEGLLSLLHVRQIPDFRTLVERNLLDFNRLLELLGSIHHVRFVGWLHNLKLESPDEVLREYVSRLEEQYSKNDVKTKGLRLLATGALSLLSLPAGALAAGVDSFLVDRLLKGWHPTLFLDKLRSTIEE
jgi:hypothetical protein